MKANPRCRETVSCDLTNTVSKMCEACRAYIGAKTEAVAEGLGMPEAKSLTQKELHTLFKPGQESKPPISGTKHDKSKVRMELLSGPALVGLSKVLTFGGIKYDDHNWRNGFKWSRLIGAAQRHLVAFMSGEDIDPESGLPHIDHLACCVMFLSEHQKVGLGTDDRHKVDFGSMDYTSEVPF